MNALQPTETQALRHSEYVDNLCLYCGFKCGLCLLSRYDAEFPLLARSRGVTVCSACQWGPHRDEAREVAAGMKPWARPAMYPVLGGLVLGGFLGHKRMDDAEAARIQAAWDAEQERIRKFNDERYGR